MYLPRVATMTVRALNGVSQLVLMWASTPEAVRNCSSAMSSRSATALDSCGCTSTMSDSVNQRIRSMSCTARSMTTPPLDMRGGEGPTRACDALAPLRHRGGGRLLDQHVDLLGEAGERDFMVQMGWRCDGDGIDALR